MRILWPRSRLFKRGMVRAIRPVGSGISTADAAGRMQIPPANTSRRIEADTRRHGLEASH
jgi:hypothetical protein